MLTNFDKKKPKLGDLFVEKLKNVDLKTKKSNYRQISSLKKQHLDKFRPKKIKM